MKRVKLLLGLTCSLLYLAGCGGGGVPGVVAAGGTVTIDGKPVEGATVSFIPDSEGARAASALTESDGSYKLTTVHPGDGAIPGKYKITVTKVAQNVDPDKPASQEEAMKAIEERMRKGGEAALLRPPVKAKDELPSKYANPATSGLMASVEESGNNTSIKLELKGG